MTPALSLWQIESALTQLVEARDAAEADGDSQAVSVIDKELDAYLSREVKKIDSVAAMIRMCRAHVNVLKVEGEHIYERAAAWEAREKRIKEAALRAMQAHDVRVLETADTRLRVQKNGGKQPLEVDLTLLPSTYAVCIVSMPMDTWKRLEDITSETKLLDAKADTDKIREALKQWVPCVECKGVGAPWNNSSSVPCPRCNGNGTVPQTIPGARLLDWGSHLRVE